MFKKLTNTIASLVVIWCLASGDDYLGMDAEEILEELEAEYYEERRLPSKKVQRL